VLICLVAALKGQRVWWVAPIYPTAKIGWRMLKRFAFQFPRTLRVVVSESEMTLTVPLTGGSVTIKSAHDPDSLRGEGLDGVVLDEAAYAKREAWTEVIRPMLIDTGGWAVFMSTPAGRNWFQELYERALHRPGWKAFQQPTSRNPKIPQQELDEALEDMGALVFEQEHGAQFVAALGTIFKPGSLHYFQVELDEGRVLYHLIGEGRKTRTYRYEDLTIYATCDPASSLKETADYTALGVFGVTPESDLLVLDMVRERFEHTDLVGLLRTAELRWRPDFIGVEEKSMGLGIIQDALNVGVNVQPLTPKGDKMARARPAANRMGNGKIWLDAEAPWLRVFETELLAFPKAAHDDQVDVLSYADSVRHQALSGTIRTLEEEVMTERGWSRVL
jgi:predicted phage terminase large subunit-like protein